MYLHEHNDGRYVGLHTLHTYGIKSIYIYLAYVCIFVGRGGALAKSTPFVRRVMGSTQALAATYGSWASPSLTVACGISA